MTFEPCDFLSADATDSSSEGSVEDEGMRAPPKQKALQTRRSILDHLDDSAKTTPTGAEPGEQAPPAKRVKKGEEVRNVEIFFGVLLFLKLFLQCSITVTI